jgi:transposase
VGIAKKRMNPTIKNRVNRRLLRMCSRKAKKIVDKLPEPWETKALGRPPHEPKIVVTMCVLKILLRKNYDEMDELADDPRLKDILGKEKLPGHSVVHRGMKKLSMEYIRLMSEEIARAFEKEIVEIIVDSTGFRLINSSSWYDIRIGRENQRKDNDKLHIICCARTGIILDFRITDWKRHDSPLLKQLIMDLRRVEKVVGDSAYLSINNCNLVVNKGGLPYFYIKSNTTARARHPKPWKEMVRSFFENRELWLSIYHIRSIIEGVFSSLKKCFGSTIKAVKRRMQQKELALKVLAYNIKQALYVECSELWGLNLWVPAP